MKRSRFRYWEVGIWFRWIWRFFFPMPVSSFTNQPNTDISKVRLVPPEDLTNLFEKCLTHLKKIKKKGIGCYLEFGVFNGSSMACMFKAAQRTGNRAMAFFGFDCFEGLPDEVENSDDGVFKSGFYKCTFEMMKRCITTFGVDPDRITWIKGLYNETLNPCIIKKYDFSNIGIVMIDCDSYPASKTVLDFIGPLITAPVFIILDDWALYNLDLRQKGEYLAFNEFLECNPHLEAIPFESYSRKAKVFLVYPVN